MKVSMNGLREQLSNDVEALKQQVEMVIYGPANNEDLANAMNDVITKVNCLNCIYANDDDLFDDMSHIQIDIIQIHGDDTE